MSQEFPLASSLKLLVVFAISLLFSMRMRAEAPQPTTTNLTISSGDTSLVGAASNFTASVSSGGKPVSPGRVLFCNADAEHCEDFNILGQAQLKSDGTASVRLRLSIGKHNIRAAFQGTTSYAASSSATQILNLSGRYSTSTAVSVAQNLNIYTFTSAIFGYGPPTANGSVLIRDANNNKSTLAQVPIGLLATGFYPVPDSTGSGSLVSAAVADINGDGNLDQLALDATNSNVAVFFGNGNGTFTTGPVTHVGTKPVAIAVGDFNNDGINDFAVTNSLDGTVSILLGKGDGTFSATTPISIGTSANRIATGDFNHDGNVDLVVSSSAGFSVLLGNGMGGFSLPSVPLTASTISPIRVNDLNGDGNADLIFINSSNVVQILLGNGDGTFTAGTPPPADCTRGGKCVDVVVADFNGDDKADIAVADPGKEPYGAGSVLVLFGNGDGTFGAQNDNGYQNPQSLALGDFNGDGLPDVVANDFYSYADIFLNHGNGTLDDVDLFSVVPKVATVGDFNNDGMSGFVLGSIGPVSMPGWNTNVTTSASIVNGSLGIHNLFANYEGDETYLPSSSATVALQGPKATTAITLDVTPLPVIPHQTLRLIAKITPSAVGSDIPTGTVTFSSGPKILGTRPVIGGQAQIVSLSANTLEIGLRTTVLTAFYSGDTQFTSSVSPLVQLDKTGALLSGSTTVLSFSPSAQVSAGTVITLSASVQNSGAFLTRGLVVFYDRAPRHRMEVMLGQAQITNNGVATIRLRMGIGPHRIRAAFQGTNAVAGSSSQPQNLTVTGQFKTSTSIAANVQGYSASVTSYGARAATGDVYFSDATNNDFTFATAQLGKATASYSVTPNPTPPYLGSAQSSVTVADFNGDGILDFATISEANDLLIVMGNPDGSFHQKQSSLNHAYSYLSIADFNSDGIPDIALLQWDGPAQSYLTIMLGAGNGLFTKEPAIEIPGSSSVVLGDFNRDGIPDLAVTSPDGRISLLLNKGGGTFSTTGQFNLGENIVGSPVVADFNGDGILDLAIPVENAANPIVILMGTGAATFITQQVPVPVAVYNKSYGVLTVADFNGDGFQDLIFNGAVLLGNGDATFVSGPLPQVGSPYSGVPADMNGDGIIDLASSNYFGDIVIYLGDGNGLFEFGGYAGSFLYGNGGSGFAIGDFNGDGIPDLMSAVQYEPDILGNPPIIETMAEWFGTITQVSQATTTNAIPPGGGTHQVFAEYVGDATHTGSRSSSIPAAGAMIDNAAVPSVISKEGPSSRGIR